MIHAKAKAPQRLLPFVTEGLSKRLSGEAYLRAIEILKQMLIDTVLGNRPPQEKDHE
jgi:hypothetical protein